MKLITDRTEVDVLLGTEKGIYGFQDLNRIEQAVAELCVLAEKLDIHPELITKTDWGLPGVFSVDSWPIESQLRRYIQNIHTLCDCISISAVLPESMENLTYQGANNIESALVLVHQRVQSILQAYKFSGEIYAGEENVL